MKKTLLLLVLLIPSVMISAQNRFNGLDMNMGNLYRLSDAKTRSISPENFTGEKGKAGMADPADKDKPNVANAFNAARDLGKGWKVNPYIRINPGQTITLAEIDGPGAIQHIWMTPTGTWRYSIIRFYWDGETEPSIECPVGDFFASGWGCMRSFLRLRFVLIREAHLIAIGQCLSERNAGSQWRILMILTR